MHGDIGLSLLPIVVGIVLAKSYRLQRFTAYLHPWDDSQDSSYQLVHSLIALGHGVLRAKKNDLIIARIDHLI